MGFRELRSRELKGMHKNIFELELKQGLELGQEFLVDLA